PPVVGLAHNVAVQFFSYGLREVMVWLVFFFNDTATTEIYTLSLHDALPIFGAGAGGRRRLRRPRRSRAAKASADRKSTRLNSSHTVISYAVFCLKKQKDGVAEQMVGFAILRIGSCIVTSRTV